jgi:hypothetical protein
MGSAGMGFLGEGQPGCLDAASVTKKMRPVSRADAALKQRYKLRRVVLTAACEEFLRHAAD